MRPSCSLYIDAGYLLAAAATRVTGTSLRSGIHVEYSKLVNSLVDTAQEQSGMPLLRVHWYDSAEHAIPDKQQERIGELPWVKLRLGRFGVDGQQKGVDLRIGLDLVTHARNNVSDVFYLVSGDDDLTEAVEEAQVHGVQVVVLAVPTVNDKAHGVSRHLVRAADMLHLIDGVAIDNAILKVERRSFQPPEAAESVVPTPAPRPATPAPAAVPRADRRPSARTPLDVAATAHGLSAAERSDSVLAYSVSTGSPAQVLPGFTDVVEDDGDQDQMISEVVQRVLTSFRESASPEQKLELTRMRPSIPRDIDRALLQDASDVLQKYDLDEGIRHRLRARFWQDFDS